MQSFEWQTPEYPHFEKSSDWYWTVGIITAALVITAMLFGNVLFAIVLAVGAFTLTIFSARKPRVVHVLVNERGVRIENLLYPYHSLESFGIDEEHHSGPKLFLKSKKIMPLVHVPIKNINEEDLRRYLSKRLKEETFEDHLMHTIFEKLGF